MVDALELDNFTYECIAIYIIYIYICSILDFVFFCDALPIFASVTLFGPCIRQLTDTMYGTNVLLDYGLSTCTAKIWIYRYLVLLIIH